MDKMKAYTITIISGTESDRSGPFKSLSVYEQVIERDLDIPALVRALNSAQFEHQRECDEVQPLGAMAKIEQR